MTTGTILPNPALKAINDHTQQMLKDMNRIDINDINDSLSLLKDSDIDDNQFDT
jgi:hypothetical protein